MLSPFVTCILIAKHFQLIVEIDHKRSSGHNFGMGIMYGAAVIHAFGINAFCPAGQYDDFGRIHVIIGRLNDAGNDISRIIFCVRKSLNRIAEACNHSEIKNRDLQINSCGEKKMENFQAIIIITFRFHRQNVDRNWTSSHDGQI